MKNKEQIIQIINQLTKDEELQNLYLQYLSIETEVEKEYFWSDFSDKFKNKSVEEKREFRAIFLKGLANINLRVDELIKLSNSKIPSVF